MKITSHNINTVDIAEVNSEDLILTNPEDALDLLGNTYGFDRIIIHERNIEPAFFDLKNGLAGDILQKFSNYRLRLAIVGDFSKYDKQSIRDFIFESNKGRQVNFLSSLTEALDRLSKL